jgi:hypothetical protein
MLHFTKTFHNNSVEQTSVSSDLDHEKSIYSLGITGKQSVYTGKSVYFMSNKGIGRSKL